MSFEGRRTACKADALSMQYALGEQIVAERHWEEEVGTSEWPTERIRTRAMDHECKNAHWFRSIP